jgi:hypothetical protein
VLSMSRSSLRGRCWFRSIFRYSHSLTARLSSWMQGPARRRAKFLTGKVEPASAPAPKCAASPGRRRLTGTANSFAGPRAFEARLADEARARLRLGVLFVLHVFVGVHVQTSNEAVFSGA